MEKILHTLAENLLTPIPLCFALGIFSKLIHGGIKIPKELYYTIAIFLLMSIGFMGGHELAHEYQANGISRVLFPALATLFLGCFTPISTYLVMRYMGRMSVADAAGIAAHFGSTSAVTYAVANSFVEQQHWKPDAYLPTLVTILECPGIAVALAIGAALSTKAKAAEGEGNGHSGFREALYEVMTGQSLMLMAGLLVIGFVVTMEAGGDPPPPAQLHTAAGLIASADTGHADAAHDATHGDPAKPVEKKADTHPPIPASLKPFIDFFYSKGMIFRGALCIFLLEMGLVAGERLGDLLKVGPFLIAAGILIPLLHGFLGAWLGILAGMNVGGATVFAAIVSSASYIAAPPAVRLTLPDANPTLSITAALAIVFPFNIAFGIPIYFEMAKFLAGSAATPPM